MTSCILFDFLKLKDLTLTLGITSTVEKSNNGQKKTKASKGKKLIKDSKKRKGDSYPTQLRWRKLSGNPISNNRAI